MKIRYLAAFALAALLSGCASQEKETSQPRNITLQPGGPTLAEQMGCAPEKKQEGSRP